MSAHPTIHSTGTLANVARRYRLAAAGAVLTLSLAIGLVAMVGPSGYHAAAPAVQAAEGPSASTRLWIEIGDWNRQQAAAAESAAP